MNNNDYLKTPEHFKMLVESKVNEQLNTPISDKKKPTTSIQTKKEKSGYHFKKIAAAAAVIAIITTTSVFAAKHFRLSGYFESSTETYNESYMETIDNRDISVKNGFPEQMKQFEQNTNKVFDEPLFTLTEAYYDGNYLYIYAKQRMPDRNMMLLPVEYSLMALNISVISDGFSVKPKRTVSIRMSMSEHLHLMD